MTRLIDLSHPLVDGLPNFPNDPQLGVSVHTTVAQSGYNLSHLSLSSMVIVEGLTNLRLLPATFRFMGFPLNIKGRDGSPIRAVAEVD